MKKALFVALLACLTLVPSIAMASGVTFTYGDPTRGGFNVGPSNGDPGQDYGRRWYPAGVAVPDLTQFGDQDLSVDLQADAVIPCFLELKFTGNGANVDMDSYGYNADGTFNGNTGSVISTIDFLPEIGGFVDGTWTPKSGNFDPRNADTYIRSCDQFVSEIWSNLNWTYAVTAPGLAREGGAYNGVNYTLPVEMRYSTQAGSAAASAFQDVAAANLAAGKAIYDASNPGLALGSYKITQEFRVPYFAVPAGHYSGPVSFDLSTL